jgi:hypothetical protein
MDEEDAFGGEFEIERIPTSMIEARPKDLVPIFNYMQTPKFQQTRCDDIACSHIYIRTYVHACVCIDIACLLYMQLKIIAVLQGYCYG